MKLTCPENFCKNQSEFYKDGYYFRKNDSKKVQRYRCKLCGKRTSTAQLSARYGQKKRTINHLVAGLLCSKVSQRRAAKILGVDKKTIHRKLIFLGLEAKKSNAEFRNHIKNKTRFLQFDDLITKEISKLKPVSVSIAVDATSRKILSIQASQIPAFGHLASIAKHKYPFRKSHHRNGLEKMFEQIKNLVSEDAYIISDQHKNYPPFVEKYFPQSEYETVKGGRGCVVGQGELKKLKRDPLYAINHTCAMLRDNVNRLVRRSWCVTQSIEMLQLHLELYMKFHNTKLV